jgi:polyisoprenoid-binding protein YceI
LVEYGEFAGSWTLDPARSTVQLKTRHTWGLRELVGAFREFSASGTVTPAGEVTGVFSVTSASVDTKNSTRDKHQRSADFFDVEKHPEIIYTIDSVAPADSVVPAGDGVRVTGSLAIRETTRPVSFDARVSVAGGEVTLDAEVPVDRSDYGLTWNMLGIAGMRNTMIIHAVFHRQ